MTRDADIVVVGAGVTGLATAYELARAGRDVLVLEQDAVGNKRGSSHGSSRIFRLAYGDERYVRLAQRALEGWRQLEAASEVQLLVQTGGLDIGPGSSAIAQALTACGVACEVLTGATASERWSIAFGRDEQVVFQADGGIVRADAAVRALAAGARTAGAELREQTRVDALELVPEAVRIAFHGGTIDARAVVVTAGAWAPGLLGPAGIELPVVPTRETVSYFSLPAVEELPPVIDWATTATPEYGILRPGQASYALPAPGVGLKAGLHHSGPVADPTETGAPEENAVRWASRWVASRFPEADPSPLATETCLYTNTADESFVLERHGRVVVGSVCSGHGFKFAPTVGRTLATLARQAAP
ncbi:MAG TPA: N-methyl-L-tryptophan oxidase [Gaiellaceae bacterium]|nr:N-methyl-L-tryptophan oxidase [Gaiellaceae bacterium]